MDIELLARKCTRSRKRYFSKLWEASIPVAEQVAKVFARRFRGLDWEDMQQNLLLSFEKVWNRYDAKKNPTFSVYLYYSFYHTAMDEMRKLDPLGIRNPQKVAYPSWMYLADVCEESYLQQVIVTEGWDRLEGEREEGKPCNSKKHSWRDWETRQFNGKKYTVRFCKKCSVFQMK